MAAKHNERVVSALKSLSSDGLILPEEDRRNFEALIDEFFDDSDDDTGSEDEVEDEQVTSHFLSSAIQYLSSPGLLGGP